MKWNASKISELVSGYGELWSSRIMKALMTSVGGEGDVRYFHGDARQIIVVNEDDDDDTNDDINIMWEQTKTNMDNFIDTLYKEIREDGNCDPEKTGIVIVATGYVCSNTKGVSSTLKRDGSDYSAAILGKVLNAQEVTIWTDVDGVLSADPRRVPNALVMPEVSFSEAMELAYYGAKVLHPKTMQPAVLAVPPIPIYIRNTFNPTFRGTRIFTSSNTHRTRDRCVCGFASIDNMAVLNVEGSGLVGVKGVSRRLFGALEEKGINVVLIAQASSEHSITLALSLESANAAQKILTEVFAKELATKHLEDITVVGPCSIIAAVGDGMSSTTGVAGKFFSALGDAKINIVSISQGCSERNISCVVMMADATRALRAVHSTFRLSHTEIRVGVVTTSSEGTTTGNPNSVGTTLLKLLESQRQKMRVSFDIDVQVVNVHDTTKMMSMSNGGSITAKDWEPNLASPKSKGGKASASAAVPSSSSSSSDSGITVVSDTTENLGEFMADSLLRDDCAHTIIFDCTADSSVAKCHPKWLSRGVHVVTANNKGLSGDEELRRELARAESQLSSGIEPGRYLREVCVGGSLPVIRTMTDLLNSGDRIRKIDGIFSVSFSYIMSRVSPANGEAPIKFSAAVKEAIADGLMEADPVSDLNNEYTARCLMVLAKELDMGDTFDLERIMRGSQVIKGSEVGDFAVADVAMEKLVTAASARGHVVRHIATIDLGSGNISIEFAEVTPSHIFAITPPGCECVRFSTQVYSANPLIVMGQAEGLENTAAALLAEMLNLMQTKVGGAKKLARTNSSVAISNFSKISSRDKLGMK
jgi:aspartokinase/homoserine dehydrogenase 1